MCVRTAAVVVVVCVVGRLGHVFNRYVDGNGFGFLEFQRNRYGFAFFQRLFQAHEHDVVAARFQLGNGFFRQRDAAF